MSLEQQLQDEIYRDPDNDGVRSIYADWLIERGDPLGTFMSLQLARCARRDPIVSTEEQALLDTHWREWIGAPSKVLIPQYLAFERGLWSVCDSIEAEQRHFDTDPAIALERSWQTVKKLRIAHWDPGHRRLMAGPCRNVRCLTIADREAFDDLVRSDPPLGIEELVLAFDVSRDPPPLDFPGLPRLRRLGVHCLAEFAPRWVERADAAGIRELSLRSQCFGNDLVVIMRHAQRSQLASLVVANPLFSDSIYTSDRSGGELVIHTIEAQIASVESFAHVRQTLELLGKLADPFVKITMQSITAEHAEAADREGLRLVARPTRFEARPRYLR